MKSTRAFLLSQAFRNAAEHSGNNATFTSDSDSRIAIEMRGGYTLDEMRTLLDDLQRVQAAYDVWKPTPSELSLRPKLQYLALLAIAIADNADAAELEGAPIADNLRSGAQDAYEEFFKLSNSLLTQEQDNQLTDLCHKGTPQECIKHTLDVLGVVLP